MCNGILVEKAFQVSSNFSLFPVKEDRKVELSEAEEAFSS